MTTLQARPMAERSALCAEQAAKSKEVSGSYLGSDLLLCFYLPKVSES